MKKPKPSQNGAFLARRSQCRLELGEEPLPSARAHEACERDVWRESSRDPMEYEDRGLRLACLEAAGNRVVRNIGRLACAGAVLEKMEDGTYGFSDVSGRPIPERLEWVPGAISISDEEQAFAPDGEPGRMQ